MAYSLEAGDVIEVSFVGNAFGQRMLNIRHFVIDNVPIPNVATDVFDAGATAFQAPTKIVEAMLGLASADYTLESIVFQRVRPTRYAKYTVPIDQAGTHADDAVSANVAYEIALRTDKATARNLHANLGQVGRWQGGTVPATQTIGGVLTVPYKALMTTLGAALKEVYTAADDTVWMPVLFHRNITDPTKWTDQVTSTANNPFLRTQRTRTVGKGE